MGGLGRQSESALDSGNNIPCRSNSLAIISISVLEFTVLFPFDF